MSQTWITSDTHFNHSKDFIWEARGFHSVEEMNESIIERWNLIVAPDDIVYHLGDVMLGNIDEGIKYVRRLNGTIYVAIGNHDTDNRIKAYKTLDNIADVQVGYRLKRGKKILFLTHYPMLTANTDGTKCYSLYGHTHQKDNFYNQHYYMYHVGIDSHDCYPINLSDALQEIASYKALHVDL